MGGMSSKINRQSISRGFTLLELLVVIALMAMLLGGIGLYRLNQSASGRLDAGVRVLSSVASRARIQAMVTGQPTRLLLNHTDSNSGYLRTILVSELIDGEWKANGPVVELPRGILVVPDNNDLLSGDWSGKMSVFSDGGQEVSINADGRGFVDYLYVDFLPSGLADTFTESDYLSEDVDVSLNAPQIYLSVAVRTGPDTVIFESPEQVAGVSISARGDIRVVSQP